MFTKRLSDDEIVVGAPAKVNLDLRVLGRRPDGYHDIDSLFQAVSLFDRLRITRDRNRTDIEISLTRPADLPTDENNLISKAFQVMKNRFRLEGGIRVELEKNIPIAAGLGGGSADGAAVILACRDLFGLPLKGPELADLSAQIGSDLPFFFSCGQAHVTGRGEIVENIELPTDYWMVLVTPPIKVSTTEAYASLRLPLTRSGSARTFRGWKAPENFVNWLSDSSNDFESVQMAAFEQLRTVKSDLMDSGALLARMSGSGPTVFGIYDNAPDIAGDRVLGRSNWTASVVKPIRLPAPL